MKTGSISHITVQDLMLFLCAHNCSVKPQAFSLLELADERLYKLVAGGEVPKTALLKQREQRAGTWVSGFLLRMEWARWCLAFITGLLSTRRIAQEGQAFCPRSHSNLGLTLCLRAGVVVFARTPPPSLAHPVLLDVGTDPCSLTLTSPVVTTCPEGLEGEHWRPSRGGTVRASASLCEPVLPVCCRPDF